MANQNQSIEERIIKNEVKLSDDFQKVVQDNEVFKNDVRAELDGLRNLLDQYNITSQTHHVPSRSASVVQSPSILNSNLSPQATVSTATMSIPTEVPTSATIDATMDPQAKMLLMLTETFAKLSTTLSDKKDESKSD